MKLLLDENLSPLTTDFLKSVLGHEAQRILRRFFARYPKAEDIQSRLFVVTEGRTRVRRKS